MRYCTYARASGEILRWTTDFTVPPAGYVCEEMEFDARDGYIETGAFVLRPARPSPFHQWSWDSKGWIDPRTPEQVAKQKWAQVRAQRDRLMDLFEWRIARYRRQVRQGQQPTDVLSELDAYMQALADITEQPDPDHIVWPDQP